MAFTSSVLGLGGSSSSLPSTYREVPLSHLRTAHQDGSPHNERYKEKWGEKDQVINTALKP